jgi:hypothetical protein
MIVVSFLQKVKQKYDPISSKGGKFINMVAFLYASIPKLSDDRPPILCKEFDG